MLTQFIKKGIKAIRSARLMVRYRNRPFSVFYAHVMDEVAERDPFHAVGGKLDDHGRDIGKLQFEFFKERGLRNDHRFLDIGCGNLRAGRYFINFLEKDRYVGIDVSMKILKAAELEIKNLGLAAKEPKVFLTQDLKFDELADSEKFDYINAHSVFTHIPESDVAECFANLHRVMGKHSRFYFTYYESQYRDPLVYAADPYLRFSYPLEMLQRLGQPHGLSIRNVERDLGGTPDYQCAEVRLVS